MSALPDREVVETLDQMTSPWVSIPAHAIEGAASDLAAALDYLAEGNIEAAQGCLVYPWTVLDTAEQAANEISDDLVEESP